MSGRSQNKRNLRLDVTLVLFQSFFYRGLPDCVWFSLKKTFKVWGSFYWNFNIKIGHRGEEAKVEHKN